jgi:hypothetical protein
MSDESASTASQDEVLDLNAGVAGLSPESTDDAAATEGQEEEQQGDEKLGKLLRRNKKLGEKAKKAEADLAARDAKIAELEAKVNQTQPQQNKSLAEQLKEMPEDKLASYEEGAYQQLAQGKPEYAGVLRSIADEKLRRVADGVTGKVQGDSEAKERYDRNVAEQMQRIVNDLGEEVLDRNGKIYKRASELFAPLAEEANKKGEVVPPEKHYEVLRQAWEEDVTGGKPLAQHLKDLARSAARSNPNAGMASPGETVGSRPGGSTGARPKLKEGKKAFQAMADNILDGLG